MTAKLALVTGYDAAYRRLAEISVPNKKAYCDKYGYDLKVYEREAFPGRSPHWSKIAWLYDSLPTADWLFWSDADSLIANESEELTDWVRWIEDFSPECNLLIGEDIPWLLHPFTYGINTGNFFLRNCEWSEILLTEIWHGRFDEFRMTPYFEQAALQHLYDTRPWVARHTVVRPIREFNSLSEVYSPEDFDFIVHYAGLPLADREHRMREFLKSCAASSSP